MKEHSIEKFVESIDRISDLNTHNEDAIYELVTVFLNNTNPISESILSPFDIFRNWVRKVIDRNQGANRNVKIFLSKNELKKTLINSNFFFFFNGRFLPLASLIPLF